MKHTVKTTTRIAAWLLCMAMAWLSVSSPHCDLWPHATNLSSSHSVINRPAPVERGASNGVLFVLRFSLAPGSWSSSEFHSHGEHSFSR
jgi:hypothetical protein